MKIATAPATATAPAPATATATAPAKAPATAPATAIKPATATAPAPATVTAPAKAPATAPATAIKRMREVEDEGDYMRKRRRNMERNAAKLQALGLLAPATVPTQERKTKRKTEQVQVAQSCRVLRPKKDGTECVICRRRDGAANMLLCDGRGNLYRPDRLIKSLVLWIW